MRFFFYILIFKITLSLQLSAQRKADSGYLEHVFRDKENVHTCTALFLNNLTTLQDSSDYNFRILQRLYIDVLEIITANEDKIWHGLKHNTTRAKFIAYFWKQRDPTRATLANERLFEHYKRLLHAREEWGNNSMRTYDDRGRVYVRYGKADETYVERPNEYASFDYQVRTPMVGNDDMSTRAPMETWFYYRLEPRVAFDFMERGDGYYITYKIDSGLEFLDTNVLYDAMGTIIERRRNISPKMQAAAFKFRDGSSTQTEAVMRAEIMELTAQYGEEMREKHEEIPPETSTYFEDLPFEQFISYFENENGTQECVVAYGLEIEDVKLQKETETNVMLNTALSDSFFNAFDEKNASISLKPDTQARQVQVVHQFNVGADNYYIFSEVNNPAQKQLGKQVSLMKHIPRPADSLGMSSVLFASNISANARLDASTENAVFRRNELFIEPHPFKNISKEDPPFVYFEIYGLKQNARGKTEYAFDYIVREGEASGIAKLLKKMNPFNSGKTLIKITDQRVGSSATDHAFVQLDLSKLGKGKYQLFVRVRDLIGNNMQMKALAFQLN